MTLKTVQCDQCGQVASLITAAPIFATADALINDNGAETATEYSCRVKCPNCGPRIQVVKAEVRSCS